MVNCEAPFDPTGEKCLANLQLLEMSKLGKKKEGCFLHSYSIDPGLVFVFQEASYLTKGEGVFNKIILSRFSKRL